MTHSNKQCASTEAILKRDPKDDEIHSKRMVDPIKAWADPYYVRTIPAEDIVLAEDIRRKSRNTNGQSELSSVSPEKKKRAEEAFYHTPPAELSESQKKRLIEMNKITEFKGLPDAAKVSLWDKFKQYFLGPEGPESWAEKIKQLDEGEEK